MIVPALLLAFLVAVATVCVPRTVVGATIVFEHSGVGSGTLGSRRFSSLFSFYPISDGRGESRPSSKLPGRGQEVDCAIAALQPVSPKKAITNPIIKRNTRASPDSLAAEPWKIIADDRTTMEELSDFMSRILTAPRSSSYRITAIPNSPATTVVAMIAERSVKRRPTRKEATPARAKRSAAYHNGKKTPVRVRPSAPS